jgi:hypothetical protein
MTNDEIRMTNHYPNIEGQIALSPQATRANYRQGLGVDVSPSRPGRASSFVIVSSFEFRH